MPKKDKKDKDIDITEKAKAKMIKTVERAKKQKDRSDDDKKEQAKRIKDDMAGGNIIDKDDYEDVGNVPMNNSKPINTNISNSTKLPDNYSDQQGTGAPINEKGDNPSKSETVLNQLDKELSTAMKNNSNTPSPSSNSSNPLPQLQNTDVIISMPPVSEYCMPMRSKWESMFTIFQSELGKYYGLMADGSKLTINKFDNINDYHLNKMELHNRIWQKFRGIVSNVPKESVNNYFRDAFPTKMDSQGIQLYEKVINSTESWFKVTDVSISIRRAIQSFSNIDVATTPPKIRINSVNVLTPEERWLSDYLHNLELKYSVINMETLDEFYAFFNDWYVFAVFNSQIYKGMYRRGYSFATKIRINYNYQILADQFAPIRLYSFRLIASSIKSQIPMLAIMDAGAYQSKLQQQLRLRTNTINEALFVPTVLQSSNTVGFLSEMLAVTLCSRWMRVDNFEDYTFTPSIPKILDAILERAVWPRRSMSDRYVKNMEIYLILNFIRVFMTVQNDRASTDYSYYDSIPDPINHYISNHTFASNIAKYPSTVAANIFPASNAISAYFLTFGPGTGWAGGGTNQLYHSPPNSALSYFTINDYEPIFGNPYVKSAQPVDYLRLNMLVEFISAVGAFTPTISDINMAERYRAIQRLLSIIAENKINVQYLFQIIERINKFWSPVLFAGPSSDDITLNKPIFIAQLPAQDAVSVESWKTIQSQIASTAVTPAQFFDYKPGSIYTLLTYYNFMDTSLKKTAPPVNMWKSGWTVNSELRDLAANIFRSLMFMPKQFFNNGERIKHALAETKDTMFLKIVKDVLTKLPVGYPGLDGLEYHSQAFIAVRDFMESPGIKPFLGYSETFFMSNRSSELITFDDTFSTPFMYQNVLRTVPNTNLILTQQDLQESATSDKVLKYVRQAQNFGNFVLFQTPINVDMSIFILTDKVLKSRYVASDQSNVMISFYTAGRPYTTGTYKFNFLWEDDPQFRNYLIIKSPINNALAHFPLKLMSAADIIGLVGYSVTVQNQTFEYEPEWYPVDSLHT